jgi:hypothetical protein
MSLHPEKVETTIFEAKRERQLRGKSHHERPFQPFKVIPADQSTRRIRPFEPGHNRPLRKLW